MASVGILFWLISSQSARAQSEYESYVQPVDRCIEKLKTKFQDLPDITVSTNEELLRVFNENTKVTPCLIEALLAEDNLEGVGYLSIVEYRDDWRKRKESYARVYDIYSAWEKDLKANRPNFQDTQLAKKREEQKQRHTLDGTANEFEARRFCKMIYAYDDAGFRVCMDDNGHPING